MLQRYFTKSPSMNRTGVMNDLLLAFLLIVSSLGVTLGLVYFMGKADHGADLDLE